MTFITSKRHATRFYISLLFSTIVFIGLATAFLLSYLNFFENSRIKTPHPILLPFSLIFYFFAGYSIHRYLKNVPRITIDNTLISFNDVSYLLTDITNLELTGKQPFKFMGGFKMEAAALTFSNGEIKYIFDDMYSNAWLIKSFLKQVVIEKITTPTLENNSIEDYTVNDTHYYQTYKGNLLLSMRAITFFLLVFFFISLAIAKPKIYMLLTATFFVPFWTLLHSYLLHYFKVSERFFVIRNHIFFWEKQFYTLPDIKEIVFETQGKMPNCLRVITNDFRNKLYPAGTLSNKTWIALKEKLESYQIQVRNECIYYGKHSPKK